MKQYQESISFDKKIQVLVNNSDAHKKQRVFIPPKKKIKILEINADAHKKKRESLSPEDRDLFDKNHSVAHLKYRKSLSPDQKVQVLKTDASKHKKQRKTLSSELKAQIKSTDAAAHKKQYKLHPPEKKTRCMEIITEKRHEHLTEEDKKIAAWIRCVAATLYEKVDLDKATFEFLREHFYKDPSLALAYFYCCSTDPCVAIFNDELQPNVDESVVWNCISNLIGSPIGQEEAMLCQETFHKLEQSHARISACASCCECLLSVDGKQGIVEMKIDDLPSEFFLTELQIERLAALPQHIVQNHIHVVNHNGTYYHLNPDLVFDVNQIVLCHVCAENPMTKDQESIAAGNNYG